MKVDSLALQCLQRTGYDVAQYFGAMETLVNLLRSGGRVPERFASHLMTTERVSEARRRIGQLPARAESVATTTEFDTLRQRISGLPGGSSKPETKPAEARTKIEIRTGMSKAEVIQILGAPQKEIVFGSKTILRFADITVELVGGKVVDLKPN
jgi:predicted Zn-dependent protease